LGRREGGDGTLGPGVHVDAVPTVAVGVKAKISAGISLADACSL
jgi:hypothetical protein